MRARSRASPSAELTLLGQRFSNGVIVTQGLPAVSGYSSLVSGIKNLLARRAPGEEPHSSSLEGSIAATILIQAMKQTAPLSRSTR